MLLPLDDDRLQRIREILSEDEAFIPDDAIYSVIQEVVDRTIDEWVIDVVVMRLVTMGLTTEKEASEFLGKPLQEVRDKFREDL